MSRTLKIKEIAYFLILLNAWIFAITEIFAMTIAITRIQLKLGEPWTYFLIIFSFLSNLILISLDYLLMRRTERIATMVWMVGHFLMFVANFLFVLLIFGTDGNIIRNQWILFPYTSKTMLAFIELFLVSLTFVFQWLPILWMSPKIYDHYRHRRLLVTSRN